MARDVWSSLSVDESMNSMDKIVFKLKKVKIEIKDWIKKNEVEDISVLTVIEF